MNPTDSDDLLAFPPAPPQGSYLGFEVKYSDNFLDRWDFGEVVHVALRMNFNNFGDFRL